MACGGEALAADERASGAAVVWWPDGDSQVLGADIAHLQPTQQGQRAARPSVRHPPLGMAPVSQIGT